jgi:hypothetical protein
VARRVCGNRLGAARLFTWHERHRVFSDCMETMACAMSNAVDLAHRDEREARYLALAKKYTSDELADFARALAALTIELGAGLDDVLGRVFSDLERTTSTPGSFSRPWTLRG